MKTIKTWAGTKCSLFSVKPISLKISWKWFDEKRTLILCFEEGRCTCSVCVFMSICLIKLWVNSHFSFCRNFSWKRPWKIFFFLYYSISTIRMRHDISRQNINIFRRAVWIVDIFFLKKLSLSWVTNHVNVKFSTIR